MRHSYTLSGSRIIGETVYYYMSETSQYEQYRLVYIYDETGAPIGLKYRTPSYAAEEFDYYFFEKSLQGDIVAIYNESGTKIGTYTYDAWGNCSVNPTSGYNFILYNNPFRYRGYYYDTETGYYYLQSRYYNPNWGRFINADGYVSTGQELTGYNMFAYCGNNPVNRVDHTGQFWSEIWEFAKTAVTEIGKAMGLMSPAYAGCGGVAVADGPLPFGDIVAVAGAALLTVGAIGYGVYQAAKAPAISIPKAEEKTEVIPDPSPSDGTIYYHVTTAENAISIMSSRIMCGSKWENGYVFAWRRKPNKYAIKNSGAHMGVVISFKTNASFVMDNGIVDPKVQIYGPVVSTIPGPIVVWGVKIVG